VVDEIRVLEMDSIYYYCGNPEGKWEHILTVGADALALEESKKGFLIEIDDVVTRVNGRCAVLGNLDAVGVLQDGTAEQLRAEIARQIKAGRRNGSRFIMSVGSPVTPGTAVERVRLYCELTRDLGSS
jgi:uroporphyrinogen-III decarboxylase